MAKLPPPAAGQFFDPRGRVSIERRGMPRDSGFASDGYHALRTWRWASVTAAIFGLFLLVNVAFGFALWLGNAKIANATGGFLDYCWFSVETMATIGYGNMAPLDGYAHAMVTLESFVGILVGAMVTGIFYARFATPRARVIFSKVAVIGSHDGKPTLMFRMANARRTAIVEANIRVYVSQNEVLSDGEQMRKVHDVQMVRNTTPLFALSWTALHPIDETSPFFGVTPEAAMARGMQIIVTFTGIDDQLAATVHSRFLYPFDQFRFNQRFVDIFELDPITKVRFVNMATFHDTVDATVPRTPVS
ncbi:MAG: hypothetical protein KBG15_05410 [Kofleriaceae bacterium]|nr:hypothetical protein [Kofleriaceae bacterium]